MAEEITMTRACNRIHWGFRLQGGKDFNSPLTVSRITGNSVAEKRGLKTGDIITMIGNRKMNDVTHTEAEQLILDQKNCLTLTVLRGSCPDVTRAITPVRGLSTPTSPLNVSKKTTSTVSISSINSLMDDDSFEFLEQSDEDYVEELREPTEEEIEQMMLENAEVLEEKGKAVIGVNFNRFIPKCDFIKDSAVFQALQEEQVRKEISEKEQLKKCPNKRFSTFLLHPDRPIPSNKKKSSKDKSKEMKNCEKNVQNPSLSEDDNKCSKTTDSSECCLRRPNSQCSRSRNNSESDRIEDRPQSRCDRSRNSSECEKDMSISIKSPCKMLDSQGQVNDNVDQCAADCDTRCSSRLSKTSETSVVEEIICNQSRTAPDTQRTVDEETVQVTVRSTSSDFEKQLNDIKNTMNALGSLPSLIESQLAAIQTQINRLLELKNSSQKETAERKKEGGGGDESRENIVYMIEQRRPSEEHSQLTIEEYDDSHENDEEIVTRVENDQEQLAESKEKASTNENQERPSSKCENNETQSEKFVEKEEQNDAFKRHVCPLTPSPRPVVLPGGRIWRKPKDAFNEEFIAETLISQAEVLVGSTLGVNFRKYETPKRDFSNSAVYKLIHDIECQKVGLENRDVIPALQDYYQSPISARHFYCASLAEKAQQAKFKFIRCTFCLVAYLTMINCKSLNKRAFVHEPYVQQVPIIPNEFVEPTQVGQIMTKTDECLELLKSNPSVTHVEHIEHPIITPPAPPPPLPFLNPLPAQAPISRIVSPILPSQPSTAVAYDDCSELKIALPASLPKLPLMNPLPPMPQPIAAVPTPMTIVPPLHLANVPIPQNDCITNDAIEIQPSSVSEPSHEVLVESGPIAPGLKLQAESLTSIVHPPSPPPFLPFPEFKIFAAPPNMIQGQMALPYSHHFGGVKPSKNVNLENVSITGTGSAPTSAPLNPSPSSQSECIDLSSIFDWETLVGRNGELHSTIPYVMKN